MSPLRPVPDTDFEEPEKPTQWEEFDEKAGEEGSLAGERKGADSDLAPGRGDKGQSSRSRNNMRRLFMSLPWELLGARPAMVSLTYPGDWKRWVPNGRVLEAHRRAFERRWVRRWGEPLVGVWVKEFQESGRPHMHLYIGVPSEVSDEDFEGLRQRTVMRHRYEASLGRYQGRAALPAIGMEYGGQFAMWLRTAWSEVVGTQGVSKKHHARGVDVAVMFWTEEVAATADRTKVAEYLAREASKWRQKRPPDGFVGVGQYFGRWGRKVGFNPVTEEVEVGRAVAEELERRLARWVGWKLFVESKGASRTLKPKTLMFLRHWGDGITAFGLGPEQAARLLRWSEAAAARKAARRHRQAEEVSPDGASDGSDGSWLPGGPAAQPGGPPAGDQGSEPELVEEGGGPVQDLGPHGLEVAAHGRGGIAVPEDALDVEQVEVVGPVGVDGRVKDAGGGPPEVMGRDVA